MNEQSIAERQADLTDEFSLFTDWSDRYQRIIEIGEEAQPLDDKYKTEENRVHGCQSQVWLHAEYEDGMVFFQADSDAIITRGLVSLLVKIFSGHTPQEIADSKLDFINEIGLAKHLSPTRSNGFANMIKRMKYEAVKFIES